MCDDCLGGHVQTCASPSEIRLLQQYGGVWCVARALECEHTYSDHTIAKHVPPEVFRKYFDAKSQLAETRIAQELEKGIDLRVQAEAKRIATMNEVEKRVADARKHVIERILQLSCPRCGQAFPEVLDGDLGFRGCFALTCVRQGCGCGFCAYCFEDCGHDAHAHVRADCRCPHNEGLFPHPAAQKFALSNRWRREFKLRSFLKTMPEELRPQLVVEVARELLDLGLDPQEFLQ